MGERGREGSAEGREVQKGGKCRREGSAERKGTSEAREARELHTMYP